MVVRVWAVVALAACGGAKPSTPPGPPIHAAESPPERPAKEACGDLVADLERYANCVPEYRRPRIVAWSTHARTTFAALLHDTISAQERARVARECANTDDAIKAALAACSGQLPQ